MPSNHLILCHPLLHSVFHNSRVFPNELVLHIRWPKYWRFSFSIIPSKEHPGLISFRMDWLDLLAVQGTPRVFSNTTVQKHPPSVPSLLYGPALTSLHDYWENHSFHSTDFRQQSDVFAFQYTLQVCCSFPSKKQPS